MKDKSVQRVTEKIVDEERVVKANISCKMLSGKKQKITCAQIHRPVQKKIFVYVSSSSNQFLESKITGHKECLFIGKRN